MAQDSYRAGRYSSKNRDTIKPPPKPSGPVNFTVKQVLPETGGDSGGGSYDGGGYGGYGGAYDGGGAAPTPPPPPPPPSEADYLKGDASYQAQVAALAKALSDYSADDTAQRTKYNTDYREGLRQLGWTPDDPKTAVNEGAWNWTDELTASGRANQNQLNDFASRGMLQSSAYAQAQNDLQRSFNDQLGTVDRARNDFLSQRDRDLAAYKNENTGAGQTARAEALARRAAQYGL